MEERTQTGLALAILANINYIFKTDQIGKLLTAWSFDWFHLLFDI